MADGNNQRPFPSNEPYVRGAPAAASAPGSGDPLAELARLIGQNDPFSEFPRDPRRAAAQQQNAAPPVEWGAQPGHSAYPSPPMAPDPRMMEAPVAAYGNDGHYDTARELPQFGAPGMEAPPFGGEQYAANPDMYGADQHDEQGFPGAHQNGPGFAQDPYFQRNASLTPESDDYYDDDQQPRRRFSVIAIAAVIALAVLGTAGAFGYRALFGTSSSAPPPPVIKADTAPSKIIPAVANTEQSNKLIQDRVGSSGEGEKLVSREEQPMDMKGKPDRVVFPGAATNMMQAGAAPPMANGSGVIVGEPKRIRTIVIRPDQPAVADPAAAKPAPDRTSTRVASAVPPEPERPAPVARNSAPPPRVAAAPPPPSNGPLSLSPDAGNAPAAAARPVVRPPPVRAAPAAPSTAPTQITPQLASAPSGGGNGSYAVQISSQRSEADAQASFRNLQNRYSNLLGGHTPIIRRVDLGERGIYYRAMVGPFSNSGEASDLCSSLKAAGADCLIQRN